MKTLSTIMLAVILFAASDAVAGDTSRLSPAFTINGYVKNMESLRFDKGFKNLTSYNLFHNRINLKWKHNDHFFLVAEFRNRLFWGEEVAQTPRFGDLLKNSNDAVNLQKTWIQRNNLVLHTNVERLFADYTAGKFNVRAGRQRINWGLNTIWNPNDIFNAYNFLDFDYEERAGADAVKLKFNTGAFSEMDIVYSIDSSNESILAARYFFNRRNYDIQFIAGMYRGHATIGGGWAGNLGKAGFKGEAQYFFRGKDSSDHLNISSELSTLLDKGWYVSFGSLLNSSGLNQKVNDPFSLNLKISPENLMPGRWNFIGGFMKQFSPLLSGSFNMVYSPGLQLLILFPSLNYNIATNLDIDLFWQSFFLNAYDSFEAVSHQGFIRMKWNF